MEGIVDITEFFRKLKFVSTWANPIKDFKWSNVPRVKLSLLSKSDDTFSSLQALLDLYNLLDGFMDYFIDYFWSGQDPTSEGPADGMNVESLWYGSQFPDDG
ncbi:hypothetical protein Tco_1105686 [Tanacetum coccineum]